jgi:hypothetical protein
MSVSESVPTSGAAPTDQASSAAETPIYPTYSTDLWDYLSSIDSLPSRVDRDELTQQAALTGDDRRAQIWDYFFRINPEDVGRPQQAEIAQLKQNRDRIIAEHHVATRVLADDIDQKRRGVETSNTFVADDAVRQARKQELMQRINENGLHFRPHGLYVLGFAGAVSFMFNQGIIGQFFSAPPASKPTFDAVFSSWLYGAVPWLIIGYFGYVFFNNQRVGKEKSEIARIKAQEADAERLRNGVILKHQEQIPALEAQLAQMDLALRPRVKLISDRIKDLDAQINKLREQIPTPTPDEQVIAWLEEDLARIRDDATVTLNLHQIDGIIEIMNYNIDITGRQVKNPMVFIGPGEIQDPDRIPPPYRPTSSRPLDRVNELRKNFSLEQLAELLPFIGSPAQTGTLLNRLQPQPMPDRARHLLARRPAQSASGYQILYGVYYIEYLYIGEHTLTMHGMFYDFIKDRVTAERTTEQYFRDVVAIERSKEFRSIPLHYNNEEQVLQIEDAPTFTLILPSGDRRTITFANRDYLLGIMHSLPSDTKSDVQRSAYIRAEIDEAKQNAEAAVFVLQDALRHHKL